LHGRRASLDQPGDQLFFTADANRYCNDPRTGMDSLFFTDRVLSRQCFHRRFSLV
jgi:hypothetical protein